MSTDSSTATFLSHEKSTLGPVTATGGNTIVNGVGGLRQCDRSASFISSRGFRQAAATRQSDLSKIERARSRTLKLTVLIVSVFIVCFTPYAVLVFWYQVDKESALQLDQTIQESLFLFAVSNSILNPYLYGIYSKNLRKEICRSFIWRAVRDFFSKNLLGDSGPLARRWTKGNDVSPQKPSPAHVRTFFLQTFQWTSHTRPHFCRCPKHFLIHIQQTVFKIIRKMVPGPILLHSSSVFFSL